MEGLTLKEVLDLGLTGVLAVGVVALWNRLGKLTDRMFVYLESAREDRHRMQAELTTLRLNREVDAERVRAGVNPRSP